MNDPAIEAPLEPVGRYVLHPAFARGGMASVHTARLLGAEGFTRLVAAKRLHPQFADDPDFVEMFLDEARIASTIDHPNVVPVLDVVLAGREVILVQEYVHGVPLSQLFRSALIDDRPIDLSIVVAVVTGILAGLHAAHEAKDGRGESLDVVHRDVSPQNVIISVDGVPRLLDFGIAKARTSAHVTLEGFFKGKIAYMPPEQLRMERVTRKADIYAAGVLMWELLAHRRLHSRQRETEFVAAVVNGGIPALSTALAESRPRIPDDRWGSIVALERIVGRALATSPEDRWATAAEMADAILAVSTSATAADMSAWVKTLGADYLEQRKQAISANEDSGRSSTLHTAPPVSGAQAILHMSDVSGISGVKLLVENGSVSPTLQSGDPAVRSRLTRLAPWLVTGGLLVVVGVLLGVVASRDRSTASPAASVAATAAAPPPAPEPVVSAAPAAPESAMPKPRPLPSPIVFVAPARIPAPQPRPAPPPTHAPSQAGAGAASPSAAVSASIGKADCNPPFFFDGTKKVFKPNCI